MSQCLNQRIQTLFMLRFSDQSMQVDVHAANSPIQLPTDWVMELVQLLREAESVEVVGTPRGKKCPSPGGSSRVFAPCSYDSYVQDLYGMNLSPFPCATRYT